MAKFGNILGFCPDCDEVIMEEHRMEEPNEYTFECPDCGLRSLIEKLTPVPDRYE